MRMIQQIFLILQIALISYASNTYAKFGESCTALPLLDPSGYLATDTAYGFIKKNIDMTTYVEDACDSQGDELKFCIRNQESHKNVCKVVEMKIGNKQRLGDLTKNPDIVSKDFISNIVLSVKSIDNKLCLTMPTSRGNTPLFCRQYTEKNPVTTPVTEVCKSLGKSCYDGRAKSQSLLSFSGLTIHCLRDTLNKVFYTGNDCPSLNNDLSQSLKPFSEFQKTLKVAIRGALILYVMIYGFKLALNQENVEINKIALFVITFIFVLYFAVGIGSSSIDNDEKAKHNGMTEFALPILVEMTSNLTEIVFLAGGSQGLCNFDSKKYESGYKFYKIWDAIDCRIGYYLGMQVLANIGSMFSSLKSSAESNAGDPINFESGNKNVPEILDTPGVFSFFTVIFGFLLSGNIMIVISSVIFVVMFISTIIYFITVYLVAMVTLYGMAYVSPIFIPMILFERTKGYFDSWLRIVISCTLQPAVIGCFIALLLTIYDSAIYGNCEFQRHDYSWGENNFSTFELRLPTNDTEKCTSSAGYKLMQYYQGNGWEKASLMIFTVYQIKDFLNLSLSLLYVMVFMLVFYHFIKFANEFASDLTGGPNMASVTASPTMLVDTISKYASSAAKAAIGDTKGAAQDATDKGNDKKSGDKLSTGEKSESSDKISTGQDTSNKGGGV